MGRDAVRGHLDLLLMAVLRSGPQHGYSMVNALREQSGGMFDLAEGTVYPALHRLERSGWVRSRWTTVDQRRRRVYQLTATGAACLADERSRWQRFAGAVQAVLAMP